MRAVRWRRRTNLRLDKLASQPTSRDYRVAFAIRRHGPQSTLKFNPQLSSLRLLPRSVRRYGQHHPVDMTVVCIDILETILIESRKSNGQRPLSSDMVASGLDGSSNKTDRTRKRGNSPPLRAFVTQASVAGMMSLEREMPRE